MCISQSRDDICLENKNDTLKHVQHDWHIHKRMMLALHTVF